MADEETQPEQEAPIVDVEALNQDLPADYQEQKVAEEQVNEHEL